MLKNESLNCFEIVREDELERIIGGLVPSDYGAPIQAGNGWWDYFIHHIYIL